MTDTENEFDYPLAFALPAGPRHPEAIAAQLMKTDTHKHIAENEIQVGYLMRLDAKIKGGKQELGSVHETKSMFQGGFKDLGLQLLGNMLGHVPQFLMVLDHEWWQQASDRDAEALVWHELCHIQHALDKFGAPRFDLDGLPVYKVHEHDVAAFRSEVERYGAWTPDLKDFLISAKKGGA